MTSQEYRAKLRALGLTPRRPSYDGGTLHEDRDGNFVTIPDPEQLSPEERADVINLIMAVHGYTLSN